MANTGIYAVIILVFNLITNGQQGKINWNQFRGPNGQGVAEADRIPVHFSPEAHKTVCPQLDSIPRSKLTTILQPYNPLSANSAKIPSPQVLYYN